MQEVKIQHKQMLNISPPPPPHFNSISSSVVVNVVIVIVLYMSWLLHRVMASCMDDGKSS